MSSCASSVCHNVCWVKQEGEAATVSLLAMAQRTVEQMDPLTAAQHADTIFTFLLKALDLRQKRPADLPHLDVAEQGSVAVLLALTMKLSEAKFKPLFLRLLDWASSPPSAQPGVNMHTKEKILNVHAAPHSCTPPCTCLPGVSCTHACYVLFFYLYGYDICQPPALYQVV